MDGADMTDSEPASGAQQAASLSRRRQRRADGLLLRRSDGLPSRRRDDEHGRQGRAPRDNFSVVLSENREISKMDLEIKRHRVSIWVVEAFRRKSAN